MMKIFNESDWFFIIANRNNEVFSTKTNTFVEKSDPNFIEWKEASGVATVVNNQEDLTQIIFDINLRKISKEATRRIIAVTVARDLDHCFAKQLNAQMRAMELTRKQMSGATLTDAEIAEERELLALAEKIKNIRAKSNSMPSPIPSDYQSDKYW